MRFLSFVLVLSSLVAPVFAATEVVYKNGTADVAVPAGQYISVFCEGNGKARVFKQVGYPNQPSSFVLETAGEVEDEETDFGPYTNATTIRIEVEGADRALYSVGTGDAVVRVSRPSPALTAPKGSTFRIGSRLAYPQGTPTAMTTAATMTSAGLLSGIITGTHTAGATAAYTLPTGTLLDAAAGNMAIGDAFEWVLINLSTAAADSITVTAGTDHTIVGAPIVISSHVTTGGAITSMGCNSSTWITRKTAANTFVTYRKN